MIRGCIFRQYESMYCFICVCVKLQVQDALLELCMCAGHCDTLELYREYGKEILQPMIVSACVG